jgi:hypothetical protein
MTRSIALAPIAVILSVVGCGGSSGTSTMPTQPPMPTGANVAMITVDAGPSTASGIASVNTPFVSVTVCAPGSTSNCQTIDHVEVDTGSYGLRILSAAMSSSLVLPQEPNGTGGPAIVECTVFADGFSWGPVKTADIQIAGEAASAVPVQIIGDPAFPGIPTSCSSTGRAEDTVATFGANGILGVGPFIADEGDYFTCSAGVCTSTAIAVALQVSNPVAYFTADNNGVIVELPAVPAAGSAALTGSLIFGIGTETNNGLGTATVYALDPNLGVFTVTYKSQAYGNSFLDSGSNAIYFVDATIPTCSNSTAAPGFFCPTSTLNRSATNTGVNNASSAIPFSVANAQGLFNGNTSDVAFEDLAAPNADNTSFDWGLPFFFGRSVYTAIADQNTPGGIGPYVAY